MLFCRNTKAPSSLFDQASSIIWCLAKESKINEWDLLAVKGFSLNNPRIRNHPRSSNGYQVKYVRIFDTRQHKKKHAIQKKYHLQTNLKKTIAKLMEYIQENYEPKKNLKILQVEKAKLTWESPAKLKNQMEQLIQIFHVALIVTDYVFDFMKNKQLDKLIPFCAQMLSKIMKKTEFWSTMEKLLRAFPDDNSKTTEAGQKLIDTIKRFPESIVHYLHEKKLEPEFYRDGLMEKMKTAFERKKNFYWKGSIKEKDMYIIRFYILNYQYKGVDTNGLLCLRRPTKAELHSQKLRHNLLGPTHYNLAIEEKANNNIEEEVNEEVVLDSFARLPSNGLNFYVVNNNNQNNLSNHNEENNSTKTGDFDLINEIGRKRPRQEKENQNEWNSNANDEESHKEEDVEEIQNDYEKPDGNDNNDNNPNNATVFEDNTLEKNDTIVYDENNSLKRNTLSEKKV